MQAQRRNMLSGHHAAQGGGPSISTLRSHCGAAHARLTAIPQVAWLTPSEIFRPHYGNGLAQCMLDHHIRRCSALGRAPFVVYELGAGTGTVARNVLDYAQEHAPEVYQDMRYITVEISESLAALQHQQVALRSPNSAAALPPCCAPSRCFLTLAAILSGVRGRGTSRQVRSTAPRRHGRRGLGGG